MNGLDQTVLKNTYERLIAEQRFSEALGLCDEAIQKNAADAALYFYRGAVQIQLKRYEEAVSNFERAITLNPNLTEVYVNQGWLHQRHGRIEEAIRCYQKALDQNPNQSGALSNLSGVYVFLERYEEALTLLQRLMAIQPNMPGLYVNLGTLASNLGERDAALEYLNIALSLDPSNAKVHWNRALVWLKHGDYTQGFSELEWRWCLPDYQSLNIQKPRWDGSPAPDKTILVLAEGGYGDTFQFYRYLPWIRQQCGRVIFYCQPGTASLFMQSQGDEQIIEQEWHLPEYQTLPEYDMYIPIMSLPALCKTTLNTIPASVPYLRVSACAEQFWKQLFHPYSHVFKVGLVWSGSDVNIHGRNRSCPIACYDALNDLISHQDIRFFSLQTGLDALGSTLNKGNQQSTLSITDLQEHLTDFHQTAAAICQLDLVITIDTAVAHLAGALGKPVWVLLPYASDWRWLHHCQDSPWYPTMTLFRQSKPKDWPGVLSQVRTALVQMFTAQG